MILQWKPFKIDLPSFKSFLDQNISNADGIIADSDALKIIEKQPFTSEDITKINNYYNSLTQNGEYVKYFNPLLFQTKIGEIQSEFTKENILMGITQSGATREIADKLRNLSYYLEKAPLEAVKEIDNLLSIPISFRCSSAAAPFLSDERLIKFKNKIKIILGMTV